ncbi:MAG: reverse transcriptase/maturase family protein [Nanoarchaeota archaeon]|nr:reverse transcriptase/maturase family protein [Nanoarchaeota archaeon]
MKTYNNLYQKIISLNNLSLAYEKARKGKTRKAYVLEFEQNLKFNLQNLHEELKAKSYQPESLKTFILRDPKTRRISKSAFRDRIVHHAIVNVLEPIFDKRFICDSCANRKGKGSLYALRRFDEFKRKVSGNGKVVSSRFDENFVRGFCLKADIKHYFNTVNHNILLEIIQNKVKDEDLIWLIRQILNNFINENGKGMPLGNLTSQFFANVYLNELDYFVKHQLKAKHYIRYVDDFVILHHSKAQLEEWKSEIDEFLREKLRLELHPDKSKIIPLSKGIDFVGFRNFYHFRLLRKRNIRNMESKVELFRQGIIEEETLRESFKGWKAYARWSNAYNLSERIASRISPIFLQII